MFSRLLNIKSHTVVSAAAVLGLASLLSRLAGVIRDRLLSGQFGAGADLDAYYAAFRAPDFIYSLFVFGAISAGFIPVFAAYVKNAEAENASDDDRAWDLASRVLTVLGLALAALAGLGALLAPWFLPALTPGFSPEQQQQTIELTRIMFLSPVLLGLSGVLGGILQTYRRFLVYSIAPILYNVGIIFGTLFLAPAFGIRGVAFGVVLGALLHCAVQLWACLAFGFRFRFRPDPRHDGVRDIVRLMLPRTAGLAVSQINLLILTGVASTVGVGSIAVFNLANNLQSFPVNILGVSFAVAAFPFIADLAVRGRHDEMAESFSRTVRNVLFTIVPATVFFLLLRAQIVRVVLGSGRFDWADTIDTADALAFFTLSLFAQALLPLVVRVFFAVKDAVTPLLVGVMAVIFERTLAWWFMSRGLGTPGLALAFSVGSILNLVALWIFLRLRVGSLREAAICRSVAVMSVGALIMAVVMQAAKYAVAPLVDMRSFVGIFLQGAVAGTLGLAAYFGLTWLAGSEEAQAVVEMYRRRMRPVPVTGVRQEDGNINPE
ncbi:MAG: murein biosynthesis integral membrane protein MurJ [Patescibacteria group bacterium]|nr:murein biosynthesis integral membrane protein MurJ [Patescibacteria group bacterium]